MGLHEQPVTHLLTGDRGSGKSTVVQRVSDRLGIALSGVLSRPVLIPSGARSGIDAELLPRGTEAWPIPLARVTAAALAEISRKPLVPGAPGPDVQHYQLAPASDPFPPGTAVIPMGPYRFSVAALAAVNDYLYRIGVDGNIFGRAGTPTATVRPGGSGCAGIPSSVDTPATTAIVIDEVGPLELRQKDGFWRGLSSLWADRRPLLLVVRPDLVDELTACVLAAGRRIGTVHAVTAASITATADAIVGAMNKELLK